MQREFRSRCDVVQGIVQFNASGILMQCVAPSDSLDSPLVVYFDEFTPRQEAVYGDVVARDDTEQNRLATYFSIVYGGTPLATWRRLTQRQLTEMWERLELYYILPPDIMPSTPIPIRRPDSEAVFYRVPEDVVLQQEYLYTLSDAAPSGSFVEVVHFGNINVQEPYTPLTSFTGTYFYKSTGSGTSISMGQRTLVAWNKVHALVQLGVTPESIYAEAGPRFRNVVDDYAGMTGFSTAETLQFLVGQLVSGKSLITIGDSGMYAYFGLGEAGDSFLALQAVTQGYTSIQLVREAQFLPPGSASVPPVGFEIIILLQPQEASRQLQVDLSAPIFTGAAPRPG